MEGITMDERAVEIIKTRRITYKNLLILCTGFLSLFIAFNALQNLQSSLHSDASLGFTSLCLIYGGFLTSCLFVPKLLITKFGCKLTILISMIGYVLYTAANFYPRWWTLVPASILVGRYDGIFKYEWPFVFYRSTFFNRLVNKLVTIRIDFHLIFLCLPSYVSI